MLNLKKEIQDYSLFIKSALSLELINLINHEIYKDVLDWEKGKVGVNNERLEIRSVKLSSLREEHIGTSVSKRIIYNDLKKAVSEIEYTYTKNISDFYFSQNNYFQFLYYDDKMHGHYDYHTDNSFNNPRTLTILIGLNNSEEYEGGELFVANSENGLKLNAGEAFIFPSNFMYPHKVSKVTKGNRKVLIAWTQ